MVFYTCPERLEYAKSQVSKCNKIKLLNRENLAAYLEFITITRIMNVHSSVFALFLNINVLYYDKSSKQIRANQLVPYQCLFLHI